MLLESLFSKIADKIISSVIAQLDPTDKLKKWLGLEPATLAYQKALSRAYIAFARQYPEYTTSLFDLTFLTEAGAPELSKLLTRHLHPDPALFAQAWSNSIGLSETSTFRTEAVKPASDFLNWLEMELKSESVFRPIFDSRALESLPELENQIEKLTAELKRGFDAAIKTAKDYEKITLEIGGDVKDSNVVIGDHNQVTVSNVYNHYHTSAFATLSDYYIPPDAVFQRVRVDEFVGRDWLTAQVDAFINDPKQKSGIVLLIGEAGVGKTSFMAHLVKERRYLHLFAEQAPGEANLPRALQSLGSQLVTRYQIDSYKDRDTLTQLSVFPDFLDKLLRLAANTLTHDEKIVIVCDALDEAGIAADGNVFGLPNVLPDNVYLILSQRPVSTKLPNVTTHKIPLEAQGSENLHDMQDYLKAVSKRAEIAGQLRSMNYSDEFFVETLKKKSLGVWMYMQYVIEEIAKGSRAPLDFDKLPTGLAGYYADYWGDWREGRNGRGKGIEQWDALYTPLLTTLAVAQQSITLTQLMKWSGVKATDREVTRLLQEQWRSFLTITESPQGKLYRPYHASFRDFLTGKVDIAQLRPSEEALVQELAEQSIEAHKRIVDVFKTECDGTWEKLIEQEYPRLHLTTHLAGAGEFGTLINLLTEGEQNIAWAETRYQKEETYAGYLNDLAHVWKRGEEKEDYALLIRCMLIENSIHSLVNNIQPSLLAELGKSGMWGYPKCLTIISQMPDKNKQNNAIKLLIPTIPKTLHEQTLSVAREIKEESSRADVFIALAPHLNDELKFQLLAAAREIEDEGRRAWVLSALAPHFNEELKLQLLAAAREIKDEYIRDRVFSELAPYLNDEQKLQLLSEALAAAREIEDEGSRAWAFIVLAPHLNDELKLQVLSEALAAARKMENEYERARVFIALAPHFNDEMKIRLLSEALAAAREMEEEFDRARVFSALAPHLNDEQKLQVLAAAHEIEEEFNRASVFINLAPHLNDEQKLQVLAAAREMEEEFNRASVFINLAPHLNEELKLQLLAAAREIKDEYNCAHVFSELAPHLNDEQKLQVLVAEREIKAETSSANDELKLKLLSEALAAALKIEDEYERARVFSALAPHLNEELKHQVLSEALAAAREIDDEEERTDFLSALVPHLNDEQKLQVLAAARVQVFRRAHMLSALAPHLNEELKLQALSEALAAAREMEDEYERARVLSALAPHLNDELKLQVLSEALAAAREIEDEGSRAWVFSALAPQLNDEQKLQVLATAREIDNEGIRAWVLSALAPHLNEELKLQVLSEALVAAREIEDEESLARVLSALAPHLNDKLKLQVLSEALSAAREIKDESSRAHVFSALAPHLTGELKLQVLSEALAAAREIKDESSRANMFSDLAPHLDGKPKVDLLTKALLGMVMNFDIEIQLGRQLVEEKSTVDKITTEWKNIRYDGIQLALPKFLKIVSSGDRRQGMKTMSSLISSFVYLGGDRLVSEILRAIRDTARWWP